MTTDGVSGRGEGGGTEVARLDATVPAAVREVCQTLTDAGHQAVTVGGAVRDALLGRPAEDWDVATSAHPDQVVALFRRTIPTGLAHGTVTVMAGRGEARHAVEVTTYRGEGAYDDARRPSSVTFGVPLIEDLARRDLVVNAIAYDPIGRAVHDPFDGRGDLIARRLRAVGDPVARFTEDGLRVMRAIRFAATLEFALDGETEAAIPIALPSLARVSRERIKVELDKLLAARRPGEALEIARRTGVLDLVAPEAVAGLTPGAGGGPSGAPDEPAWRVRRGWIDGLAAGERELRCAALLSGLSTGAWATAGPEAGGDGKALAAGDPAAAKAADAALRRLKAANDERDRIVRLVRIAWAGRRALTEPALRRLLAALGRARGEDAARLWETRAAAAAAVGGDADAGGETAARARIILARGDALAAGELTVTGADLMRELGLAPGREIGRLLELALDAVLDDPARNQPAALLELARAATTAR